MSSDEYPAEELLSALTSALSFAEVSPTTSDDSSLIVIEEADSVVSASDSGFKLKSANEALSLLSFSLLISVVAPSVPFVSVSDKVLFELPHPMIANTVIAVTIKHKLFSLMLMAFHLRLPIQKTGSI